jgi:hypothetical protein
MRGNLLTLLGISFCFVFELKDVIFTFKAYTCSNKKILKQASTSMMEVGIVSWRVVNKHKLFRETSKHAKIEGSFKCVWCHLGIFGSGECTINWCFHPQLYFLDFID